MNDPLGEAWEEIIADEAAARRVVGAAGSAHRPLSKEHDIVGLIGEMEFARQFGLPLRFERRGDGGWDFVAPLRAKIDVKTLRDPAWLLVEEGKVLAYIYVLAHYLEDKGRSAELLGWTYRSAVLAVPPRAFPREIVNHVIPAADLHPMEELHRLVMRLT